MKRMQHQQIGIPRHQGICFSIERHMKKFVVSGITADCDLMSNGHSSGNPAEKVNEALTIGDGDIAVEFWPRQNVDNFSQRCVRNQQHAFVQGPVDRPCGNTLRHQ